HLHEASGSRKLTVLLLGQPRFRIYRGRAFPDFEMHFRGAVLRIYQRCPQCLATLHRLPALHGRISELRVNREVFTVLHNNGIRTGHVGDLDDRAVEIACTWALLLVRMVIPAFSTVTFLPMVCLPKRW